MESVPLFLTTEEVKRYHAEQMYAFGGATGLRDDHLLESAVAAPQSVYRYKPEATLFDLATAYAFHISQNQAFFDGNKRTGLQCALGFLKGNGYVVETSAENLSDWMFMLAERTMSESEFSRILCSCSVRREGLTAWLRRTFLGE